MLHPQQSDLPIGKPIRTIVSTCGAAFMTSQLDAIRAAMRANYLPAED